MAFKSPIPNIWHREAQFLHILSTMECRGVLIDQSMCRDEKDYGEGRMYWLHKELGNLSPTSGKDLTRLFKMIGLPLSEQHKTDKGNYSFDKVALEEYYEPLLEARQDAYGTTAKKILEYRGWQKTVTSNYGPYLKLVSPDGRVRPNYNQNGARTSRLSCSEPNLQQIPRESAKRWNGGLKKAFVPKHGFALVGCDYSQLEFRLSAGYAGQENLMELFNKSKHPELYSKEERDIFTQLSNSMQRPRQDIKTLAYAKGFGAAALKIALMLGEDLPEWVLKYYNKWKDYPDQARAAKDFVLATEAGKFYTAWEEEYSATVQHAKTVNAVAKSREFINLWTGRKRHFPNGRDSHKAYNSLIQGGGAEIVKSAMIRLFNEVDNPDCLMLLQVHDSVVFEIRESKVDYYVPIIQEVMARVEEEKDFGVYFATEPEFWGK